MKPKLGTILKLYEVFVTFSGKRIPLPDGDVAGELDRSIWSDHSPDVEKEFHLIKFHHVTQLGLQKVPKSHEGSLPAFGQFFRYEVASPGPLKSTEAESDVQLLRKLRGPWDSRKVLGFSTPNTSHGSRETPLFVKETSLPRDDAIHFHVMCSSECI